MTHPSLSSELRRDLHRHLEAFSKSWAGYDAINVDPEVPHDQRTAVNRLLALADFITSGHGRHSQIGSDLARIRDWQKRIGPLRDLDITRDWLKICVRSIPASRRRAVLLLDQELADERHAILEHVRHDARGHQGAVTRVALRNLGRHLSHAIDDHERLGDGTGQLLRVQKRWMKALLSLSVDHSDEALHAFRAKNKALRSVVYTLNRWREKQGDRGLDEIAQSIDKLHNLLGDLSDLRVLRDTLRLRRARWAAETLKVETSAQDLEAARERLESERFAQWFRAWPTLKTLLDEGV